MSMFSIRKTLGLAGAVALTALGGVLAAPAGPASAATPRNGVCESGEFCLYWGLYQTDSVSDFNTSIPNYGASQPTCYDFRGPGLGKGECVKNNAMSVWNRTSHAVTVYFNSGYGGAWEEFASGVSDNLAPGLKLENASHQFL